MCEVWHVWYDRMKLFDRHMYFAESNVHNYGDPIGSYKIERGEGAYLVEMMLLYYAPA